MARFVKERELQEEPGIVKPVEIDDACAFLARFNNGAMATFESTRYARGRKNQNTFEVNGEKGSIAFNLENAHELCFFSHGDAGHLRGWRNIQVWDSDHPYMANWWVPGCSFGYEHTFINALRISSWDWRETRRCVLTSLMPSALRLSVTPS